MRRTSGILIIGLLCAAPVSAQHAGAFSRVGFGARGIAMGNAITADVSGYASPYYNPALAPFLAHQSLDVSAALMSLDRQLQYVQLSTPLRPLAGIAGGLIHAGVSDFDGRNSSGYHTGTFSTNEYAFFMAFGVRIGGRMTVGVGLSLFRSDLYPNVSAARSIGLDLGASFRVTERLQVGAVVDDLLAEYTWDTSQHHSDGGNTVDTFPRRIRVGASYSLSQVYFSVEYESRLTSRQVWRRDIDFSGGSLREVLATDELSLHESRFRAGAEYFFIPRMAIRGGATSLGEGAFRPSAGFMVEQPLGAISTRAEYVFVLEPYQSGTMHMITLRFLL